MPKVTFLAEMFHYLYRKRHTLMMERVRIPEKFVNSYQCTRRHNPEDSHLQEIFLLEILKIRIYLENLGISGKILK
jgi:hypothetical protein